MKVAVLGKSGQVATELQRCARNDVEVVAYGRDHIDLAKPLQILPQLAAIEADVVINAAAYTNVDGAEDANGCDLAYAINAASVAIMARQLERAGIPLVHISTDYVFAGDGNAPWKPDDDTHPLGRYGASKLAGETALARCEALRVAILRTSWVFSAHGGNFVRTMLKYGAERPELKVVADQFGGPTPAAAIAETCLTIAKALVHGQPGGTYHFSGAPDVSWADFAREIMKQANLTATITDILTCEWPTSAARPLNSRLDCASLEEDFGIGRPDWRRGLSEVLKELGA